MPNNQSSNATPIVAKNQTIDTCGFLTWWEFHNIKITVDDLRDIISNHSYDIKVPDIDKRSSLLQAIREYRFSVNSKRFKTELAFQDDNEIVVNILIKEKVDDKKVEWHHADSITWEIANHSFLSKGISQDDDVMKACKYFIDLYTDKATMLGHDFVRPNILQSELAKINAISLRSRGGVYFVDNQYSKEIENLNNLCSDIQGVQLCVCTMRSDQTTKQSIANQVRSSFEERLKELQDKTSEWKNRTRNLRKDTMTSTLQEFVDLKNQLEIYQISLSMKSDDLLQELSDLEQIANDICIDQSVQDRGVSGAVIKRWEHIMRNNGGCELNDYKIPYSYLESLALPECHYEPRFYKASTNSSAYRALLHIGYIASLDEKTKTLELSKI